MALILPLASDRRSAQLQRVRSVFPEVPASNITWSYLKKDQPITNTTSNYTFNFNQPDPVNNFTTDKLLDKNNVFVVTEVWYGIGFEPASTSDNATQYITYVNNQLLVTAGAGTTLNDYEIYWNGNYTIKTGLMETLPVNTRQHYFAGFLQQTSATTRSSYDGSRDGVVQIEPMPIFSGSASQQINLSVPAGYTIDVVPDAGTIKLSFELRGWVVFNAADYRSVQMAIDKSRGFLS